MHLVFCSVCQASRVMGRHIPSLLVGLDSALRSGNNLKRTPWDSRGKVLGTRSAGRQPIDFRTGGTTITITGPGVQHCLSIGLVASCPEETFWVMGEGRNGELLGKNRAGLTEESEGEGPKDDG